MSAKFLPVSYEAGEQAIPFLHDPVGKTIWGTQQQIADTFGVGVPTVNEHLQNLQTEGEIDGAVIRKFRRTASDGKTYQTFHYNLRAICAVGYRVKSDEAQKFRSWATDLIEAVVVGGSVVTKDADDGLKQMLAQIARDHAATQRILAQNHSVLVGEVKGGFIKIEGRLIPLEEWQREHTKDFRELKDEVTLRIPRDDREKPSSVIRRQMIHVVEKRLHGLCLYCNNKDHPLLIDGPLHGGVHFATRDEVEPDFCVEFDHFDNVGSKSIYGMWPLHRECHVKKHNNPQSYSQSRFVEWQRLASEEFPPPKADKRYQNELDLPKYNRRKVE